MKKSKQKEEEKKQHSNKWRRLSKLVGYKTLRLERDNQSQSQKRCACRRVRTREKEETGVEQACTLNGIMGRLPNH